MTDNRNIDIYRPAGRIRLRPGKEESLLRYHPWVFSGAVGHLPEGLSEGDLVTVESSEGRVLGIGHWQIGSIAVRILEFGAETLSEDFYTRRLHNAFQLRSSLGLIREDNDCYRLV
ncbi:MAG: class I SAM-dependent rRNA methyltransferase, partial [Muribaculaceae bacterium]|nr:class I SAM-dependent rRNA methyltransferase [Muribaculaceae bacterium]